MKGQQPLRYRVVELVQGRQDLSPLALRPALGGRCRPFQILNIQSRYLAATVPGVHGRLNETKPFQIPGFVPTRPARCSNRNDDPASALPRAKASGQSPVSRARSATGRPTPGRLYSIAAGKNLDTRTFLFIFS